jgi:hypothetical protein
MLYLWILLNNNIMRQFLFLALVCFVINPLSAQKFRARLIPVSEGWAKNSVNTTIFRSNSLVTHNGWQYTAFYNEDGFVVLGKRKSDSRNWELRQTAYKGNVKDAHNVISLMIDGNGFLHISWDHHGDSLRYVKSVAPESLILGTKESMTGKNESNVTYPEFYQLPDGNLLFAYRDGSSGNGNLILNRYDTSTRTWSRVQDILLDGQGQRNAYWQLCVDQQGRIHISWVWRETYNVETNHDLCYARSDDGGNTWKKSDGEAYTLPITASNAEYICRIPQKRELINQTSMTCDAKGRPYIASYWRSADSGIPQYRLLHYDGLQWHCHQVSHRKTPFSLSGSGTKRIPISRPRLVVSEKHGKNQIWYLFRDEERGSKVSLAFCPDLKTDTWTQTDLTDFSVGSWEPSYDNSLWASKKKLQIFVQETGQGDGEKLEDIPARMIYILDLK